MHCFGRLSSLLVIAGCLISSIASAQPNRRAPFIPACNLHALNRAYVTALNQLRQQLDLRAPTVQFDSSLYVGAVLHLAKMEQADSLFHDKLHVFRSAELCGTRYNLVSRNPVEVAQYMLQEFENSEPHCQIQSDTRRVYVAMAVGNRYAVVRLAYTPAPSTKEERAAYTELRVDEMSAK